ncbi:MAG: methyltransferase domain-containing protein [Bacteroidetes bacterium]|nr:methyltransferase domain-containing protein [Bacteroidota bacterium]
MDENVIQVTDLYRNLEELDTINKQLGGYRASLKGLKSILKSSSSLRTILDIGFGGGPTIEQFSRYAERNKHSLFLYGVDIKKDCLIYAEKNLISLHNIRLICSDVRDLSEEFLQQIHIIHCSLFLHHLSDDEIVALLKFCKINNCIVLVNDLHRNWLAYYSIKILTELFSKSTLVKHDAPLSVKRGFKREELILLFENAGFQNVSVQWTWAFRYIVIAKP